MTLTPDQEHLAVALWVEKHRGADGPRHIAEQIGRLALADDRAGIAMWQKVAACLGAIRKADRGGQ